MQCKCDDLQSFADGRLIALFSTISFVGKPPGKRAAGILGPVDADGSGRRHAGEECYRCGLQHAILRGTSIFES